MPLSNIQSEILHTLASHRDPESYVAGSKPINRNASCYSGDIDIFHDRDERVATAAIADAAAHPVDLATNKVMAAAGRRELRDTVDIVTVHQTILSLGALVWAAVEKAPGFTPEGLIAEIRRNSNYPVAEWRELTSAEPLDPKVILAELRAALDHAEAFVLQMPTDKIGLLFLKDGRIVQPDPAHLEQYKTHAGQRRGQWPNSAEISGAMLESYNLLGGSI